MDCAGVASHLVAYHFATVSDEERDAIDAHLLGCKACLEAYFALKLLVRASVTQKRITFLGRTLKNRLQQAIDLFPPIRVHRSPRPLVRDRARPWRYSSRALR